MHLCSPIGDRYILRKFEVLALYWGGGYHSQYSLRFFVSLLSYSDVFC
jgi:hypothetical protein